jgi:gliding motility associated protien GldN
MRTMKIILVSFILLMMAQSSNAQYVLDGVFQREHTDKRRVVPYASLREADVMWNKRIWRRMDLREKMNHPFYYPQTPINDRRALFDVIKDALLVDGTLTAYSPGAVGTDDEFTTPMTVDDVKKLLSSSDTIYTEDIDTGEFIEQVVQNDVRLEEVKWIDIKEEWFFDNQRSVMDVRIIGICPMIEKKNDMGETIGSSPLFWLYFPECRRVFANVDVFNRFNDIERRTLDDLFWKRQFSSYIIKESNVFDRFIGEYKAGLDALLEAERIKEQIFFIEHDVWDF